MYEKEIAAAAGKHHIALKIRPEVPVKTSALGAGESHRNILVQAGSKKFVFRLGLNKRAGARLQAEFDTLRQLPPATGPTPWVFDGSESLIPKPFSILSFIEGGHVYRWSAAHLAAHGKKLARLHRKEYRYFESSQKRAFDLGQRFRGLARESERFAAKDELFRSLLQDAGKLIHKYNGLFLERRAFSLIHADLYADNILFRGDRVRYVDWELATIGDPAEDLARFYCHDFSFSPWYVKLSARQLRLLLDAYRRERTDDTLAERVALLNIHYHCGDLLYYKRKLERYTRRGSAFPAAHYLSAAEGLGRSLRRTLDRPPLR